MRTIIAGSRTITDPRIVADAVAQAGWEPSVVLSGTAMGIDRMGESWAKANGIPVERYPADWDTYGKSAGYKRNAVMAKHAEALIAIWDGQSRGTGHMINIAQAAGLNVHVHNV